MSFLMNSPFCWCIGVEKWIRLFEKYVIFGDQSKGVLWHLSTSKIIDHKVSDALGIVTPRWILADDEDVVILQEGTQ